MDESPGFLARTWAGVRGFVGGVFNSIPRTVFWTIAIFAASSAMGSWDFLSINGAGSDALLSRLGISLALGAGISGAMGAYQGINALNEQHAPNHGGQQQHTADTQRVPQQQMAGNLPQAPRNLPPGNPQLQQPRGPHIGP